MSGVSGGAAGGRKRNIRRAGIAAGAIAGVGLTLVMMTLSGGPHGYLVGSAPDTEYICSYEDGIISDARSACFGECEAVGLGDDHTKECKAECRKVANAAYDTLKPHMDAAEAEYDICDAVCVGGKQYMVDAGAIWSEMGQCSTMCGDDGACAKSCRDMWHAERFALRNEYRGACSEGLYACQWNAITDGGAACAGLLD